MLCRTAAHGLGGGRWDDFDLTKPARAGREALCGGAGRPVVHLRVAACAKRSVPPADLQQGIRAVTGGFLGRPIRRSGSMSR
jgi:hypothetical protein